jgi:tRNA 5-methylaminomethyl-2-thiouridine biosynthesis bifunctional protein
VQWLALEEAKQAAGIRVPCGGWLFQQGGWLNPAGYAQTLLDEARHHANIGFLARQKVERLQRITQGEHTVWQALNAQGQPISQAPVVVLASANDTTALVSMLDGVAALPLSSTRGQISSLPLGDHAHAPKIPVAGAGYVLPAHEGRLLFGATSDADDLAPAIREADHRLNLAQATQLGSCSVADSAITEMAPNPLPPGLQGRVSWRATTPDRLPYIGPLPLTALPAPAPGKKAARGDQPRFVPRLRDEHGGVYVFTGLGSRGITWAALAGELLASWVTGSPSPVEACLRDALDPARVVTRARSKENQADASA